MGYGLWPRQMLWNWFVIGSLDVGELLDLHSSHRQNEDDCDLLLPAHLERPDQKNRQAREDQVTCACDRSVPVGHAYKD